MSGMSARPNQASRRVLDRGILGRDSCSAFSNQVSRDCDFARMRPSGQPQGPAVPALGLSDSGVRRLARRCRRIQPFENLGIVYEDGTNPISCFANVIL